jgi:hypothetical protein
MRMRERMIVLCAAWFASAAIASPSAWAWHEEGHQAACRSAVASLGKDAMPTFFQAGAGMIAHACVDPDCFTRPIAPSELHEAESPEHHFDLELLEGNAPPARRYEYLAFCAQRKIDPRKAGLLPFAVAEWTQRLTVALAEYRKWPDNPYIQQKCLLYAGILSHYAADLCQPLHTTIHYDGRSRSDGNSPRSGIHSKVDALLGKLAIDANRPLAGVQAAPMDDLLAGVMAEIAASHALVERVYELEKDLPTYDAPLAAGSPAARFAAERLRACARFIASLYLTAWRDSAKIKLPEWLHREAAGGPGEKAGGADGKAGEASDKPGDSTEKTGDSGEKAKDPSSVTKGISKSQAPNPKQAPITE